MKPFAILLMFVMPCAGACAQSSNAPAAAPNHLQNAIAQRDAGRIPKAVAEFDKAGVHLAPGGIQMFYSELASRQWCTGHLQAAVQSYRDGIQAAPDGAMVGFMHDSLARLFYNEASYAEAVPEFRAATLTQNFNNAWTWLVLGTSLHRLGRDAEARAAWQQASISADPWHTHARQSARTELKHLATRSHE